MVCYTIPSTILAMAIGAMGSETTTLRKKGPALNNKGETMAGQQAVRKDFRNYFKTLGYAKEGLEKDGSGRNDVADDVADLTSFIEGTYAIVMEDGQLQGSGLGLVEYDGVGNFSGNLAVNGPDPDHPPGTPSATRRFFTTPIQGYYTPDEVEEGVFFEHLEYDDTPLGPLEFHTRLMIAEKEGSKAVRVLGSHLEPSPFVPRALIKFEMTPHRGKGFNNASLKGRYALHLRGGNPDEGNAYGHMMFYGDGNFHGFLEGNPPQDETTRGAAFSTGLAGSYSVNDNGTGVQQLEMTDTGFHFNADFLILEYTGNQATRVRSQFQEPSPIVKNLVEIELTYIGN